MTKKRIDIDQSGRYYVFDGKNGILEYKKVGFFSDSTLESVKVRNLEDALAYIRSKGEQVREIRDM